MNILLSLFHWILETGVRGSLLSVAILLLQIALRPIISPCARYLLWLPAFLVLTIPILPRSAWSLENLFVARAQAPAVALAPLTVGVVEEGAVTEPMVSVSSIDWKESAVAIIWAAGAMFSLAGGLSVYGVTLRRFMRVAEEPDDSLKSLIASLSAELRLRRTPRVILSRAVESPAVTGVLRPVLLLPADFGTLFAGQEARLVLKHELMHLKRFDLPLNALVFVLNTLHWFNPVLWLAAWRARQDREAACDAQVLASEPSDCRGDYGQVLLKAESARYAPWLSIGFVGIFEPGRVMRSRVEAIGRFRRPGPLSCIVAGTTILLLAVLGATHAQTNQPPAPTTTAAGGTAQPTRSQLESVITKKMNNIIIPRVDFRDASLREAVDFLKQKSIELDNSTTDPAQRGVNLVLQLSGTGTAPDKIKITLSLTNKSLASVLQSVCQAANVKMKVDPNAVEIVPADVNVEEMITKEYRLLAPFDANQKTMDFLEAKGVKFPPGASAIYFQASGRLIVHDTEANIDLIDPLVVKRNAGQPDLSPAPKPTPVPGSVDDKFNRIIIPKLEYRDATVPEAIDYLEKKSIALDTAEADPSKRGVKITLAPGAAAGDARITLTLTNIPLLEALKYVCQLANLKLALGASNVSGAVLILPAAAPTPPAGGP